MLYIYSIVELLYTKVCTFQTSVASNNMNGKTDFLFSIK